MPERGRVGKAFHWVAFELDLGGWRRHCHGRRWQKAVWRERLGSMLSDASTDCGWLTVGWIRGGRQLVTRGSNWPHSRVWLGEHGVFKNLNLNVFRGACLPSHCSTYCFFFFLFFFSPTSSFSYHAWPTGPVSSHTLSTHSGLWRHLGL